MIDIDSQIDEMIANSYRNFHVKGFDYVCLQRSPVLTTKIYFFDGNVSQLPEVVNPHDHRYNFRTMVLNGKMSNSVYLEDPDGKVYNEFEWRTPLNGGDGFTWKQETHLREITRMAYKPKDTYFMRAEEFHTIRMHAEGTVIQLDQYADRIPEGIPTRTFMQEKQPPALDGLYEKFTVDQIKARLTQYEQLCNKLWRR